MQTFKTGKLLGELREAQLQGDIKLLKGNKADFINDENFKQYEGYSFPEHEKSYYHIVSQIMSFHENTGKALSKPQLQKHNKYMFEFMKINKGFEGKRVYILHDPSVEKQSVVDEENNPINQQKRRGRKPADN